MKIISSFTIPLFFAILSFSCSKGPIVCDEWSASEGNTMQSEWSTCKDNKNYALACSEKEGGWDCSCNVNEATQKTFSITAALEGDRVFWTETANKSCGWNLSPK